LRFRQALDPVWPHTLQSALKKRKNGRSLFGLSHEELKAIMERTPFKNYGIASHACESPLWNGKHQECLANKD
jgi:hypothetical protein